ncbi:myb DNA-binding domain containing protein [Grosmannia clavigera kw1407]|uniref:Myb DNA-binding domain containing protein n=1 Tax=Grosmannia clavigera (strain kw1407 / UAMH 11150) TaxID=655863 RepID=F0XTP9_GROCL|nr:myb DNA-binding domain containing protein [Grosmannia clavigera kw1407]EFW99043.1 myb DNA-binding domain containing protein [Grosmannia clavigera kw1407]
MSRNPVVAAAAHLQVSAPANYKNQIQQLDIFPPASQRTRTSSGDGGDRNSFLPAEHGQRQQQTARLFTERRGRQTATVDIASLLKTADSDESPASPPSPKPLATLHPPALQYIAYQQEHQSRSTSLPPSQLLPPAIASATPSPNSAPEPRLPPIAYAAAGGQPRGGHGISIGIDASIAAGVRRSMPPYTADSPAKKQSKWSAEEDSLIIELRGGGMKWEDISKRLPGRSAISCRLHYQNYLERRSEWDEERKNKLARLYERFKPEMWARVAEEMQVPWRAAEAMHWQLGEADMARRAGVTPFSLSSMAVDSASTHHRQSPSRAPYSHGQGGIRAETAGSSGSSRSPRYGRGGPPPPPAMLEDRPFEGGGRREPGPRTVFGGGYPDVAGTMSQYQQQQQQLYHPTGLGLPPIQTAGPPPFQQQERAVGGGALPSLAEITTGVSPYSTPAYSLGTSPAPSQSASPVSAHIVSGPIPRSGYGFGGPGPGPIPGLILGPGPGSGLGPSTAYGLPGLSYPPMQMGSGPEPRAPAGGGNKRRASPNFEPRERRRRQL